MRHEGANPFANDGEEKSGEDGGASDRIGGDGDVGGVFGNERDGAGGELAADDDIICSSECDRSGQRSDRFL